jgi:hypothetical protein
MKKNLTFAIIFSLCCYSCKEIQFNFEFEMNKIEYQQVVDCLLENYYYLYDSTTLENSVSLYSYQMIDRNLCHQKAIFFDKRLISYVSIDRDSTISFYSEVQKGMMSKQYILMYASDSSRVFKNVPNTAKLMGKIDEGWYEFYRVITMAD